MNRKNAKHSLQRDPFCFILLLKLIKEVIYLIQLVLGIILCGTQSQSLQLDPNIHHAPQPQHPSRLDVQ